MSSRMQKKKNIKNEMTQYFQVFLQQNQVRPETMTEVTATTNTWMEKTEQAGQIQVPFVPGMGYSYGCGNNDVLSNVCDEIIPGLFLGDYVAASDKIKMEEFDVIVNMIHDKKIEYENKTLIHVPIKDSPKQDIKPILTSLVPQILAFLSEGKKVFVHCMAGISRSASIVIGCVIVQMQFTFSDALRFVKSRRMQKTSPNFGFEIALKEFATEQGMVEREDEGKVEEGEKSIFDIIMS
jgi:protein-tyrosine phosphatase